MGKKKQQPTPNYYPPNDPIWHILQLLMRMQDQLRHIETKINLLLTHTFGSDLEIVLANFKEKEMLTVKCQVTGAKPKAIMPQVNLSDVIAAGGLILQLVDGTNKPINPDPTKVTGAMTVSDPSVTVIQGADTLHWSITVPVALATSGNVITDSGVVTYNAGTPGPFNASLPILCDVVPPPPVPVDLQIILA